MHVANLFNLNDGSTNHNGPTETRCRINGGKNNACNLNVPKNKVKNGRVRLSQSNNNA